MSNKPLSVFDFKNWLSGQKDLSEFFNIGLGKEDPEDEFVGREAIAKVSEQKLMERIETEDNAEVLVSEFLETGGTVLSVEGKKVQIETDSGIFSVPRFCVRIKSRE